MRARPAPVSGSNHYVWRVDNKPVAVHLNLDVVRQMQPLLSFTPGVRTDEAGGILLGQVREVSDSWIVAVDDFALFESEHARGGSWTLSARDRQQFGRQLRRLKQKGPVGWFRTHTRPGLFLDQHDFNLFREFFSHAGCVALAIHPEPEHGAEAGFFFWENGDIQRARPYRPFRFRPEALAPTPTRELAPAVVELTAVPAAAAAALRVSRPAAVRTVPPPVTPPLSFRRKALYMAPIAAGLAAGILWQPRALRGPSGADISNGAATQHTARAVFAPPANPEPAPEPQVFEPVPEPAPVQAVRARVQQRSRTATPAQKKLTIAVTRPRLAVPEPKLDFRPPEIAVTPRLDQHPFAPAPSTPQVAATVETVQVSGVRRAVGSIPGLGFLKRKRHDDAFVPPRPLQRIQPPGLAMMTEDEPVRVRVTVGPSGEVSSAELVSRKIQPAVARAAIEAARKWRFAPATVDDKPVSAQLILSFSVAGSGTRGI